MSSSSFVVFFMATLKSDIVERLDRLSAEFDGAVDTAQLQVERSRELLHTARLQSAERTRHNYGTSPIALDDLPNCPVNGPMGS